MKIEIRKSIRLWRRKKREKKKKKKKNRKKRMVEKNYRDNGKIK